MPKTLNVETFVVDNGSKDGSAEAVKSQHPWVKTIALPRNMGFSAGCNAALRQANGRYFMLLNNDTFMKHKLIERCVRHLDENPSVGITGPIIFGSDGAIQSGAESRASINPYVPKRFQKRPAVAPHGFEPISTDFVSGACMFIRPEVLENRLLPDVYFFYGEDWEICLRHKKAGGEITLLPDVSIFHIGDATTRKLENAEARIEHQRSLYLFLRRNYGRIAKALAAVSYTLTLARRVILRAPTIPFASEETRFRWNAKYIQLKWHLLGCPAPEKGWGIPRD